MNLEENFIEHKAVIIGELRQEYNLILATKMVQHTRPQ